MTKKKASTPRKPPASAKSAASAKNEAASTTTPPPPAGTTLTTTVTMAANTAANGGRTGMRRKRGRDQEEARKQLLEQDEELAQGVFGAAVGIDMKSDEEIEAGDGGDNGDSDDELPEVDPASDSEVAADSDDETDSEAGFYEGSEDDDDDEEEAEEDAEPGLDPALNPLRGTIWPEIDATPDSDSDTEQFGHNTVGKIPMEWYKDMPHIGYDLDGKPIMKSAVADELDKFLANVDDPNTWKTVRDELEQQDVVLSPEELQVIQRMQQGHFPDAQYNPYEPMVEFFSSKTSAMPVTGGDEPKRRFIRSKWEAQRIMQLVRYIRHGVIRRDKHKCE
ncbi:NUC169 domain-containing protein [Syncephalis pseudoplumigaleata]|uniref:NUC169 domain-containing protein n=1 Tax=Syncephalis pseudoplumigaleata TaxID=1712513 RepID=A0A4P9YYY2_9FUNG|nr:NUC169 domain-containing protein [Syncephalis pseudoplumigaleata]|eukprot:RKP25198.1 NUC169 domain-containing protein [Syncephalis pseudoplumigaleata]